MNKKPRKNSKSVMVYEELHWDDLTERSKLSKVFGASNSFVRTIIYRYNLYQQQGTTVLRELLSVGTLEWLKAESQKQNMTFSQIVASIIEQHRKHEINLKLSDENLKWLRKEAKENNVPLAAMLDAIVLDSRLESEE